MTNQIHAEPHEHAGKTVQIVAGQFKGEPYRLEDWWDRVGPGPWGSCDGNPACLDYAARAGTEGVPPNNEVVYGKIGAFGKLIHVTQLGDVLEEATSQ